MISSDPSPLRPSSGGASSQRSIASTSTWKKPTLLDSSDVQNNQIAQGFAAGGRGAFKDTDRNGISRGKGQLARAAMQQAQGIAEGQSAAAQTQVDTDKANSGMMLGYEHGREMEAQRLAMVQHALSQSDWSVGMAQQQAAAAIQRARQQAMLQLLGRV
jgi:hypothetical protein